MVKIKSSLGGFTLIELLVVIAVIGILAAVVLASLSSARQQAKITRAKADLSSLNIALELLSDDTGKWVNGCMVGKISNQEGTLVNNNNAGIMDRPSVGIVGVNCQWTQKEVDAWNGPYATNAIDPWGHPYFFDPDYCVGNNIQYPVLSSFGPDGEETYGPNCTMALNISVQNPDDIVYILDRGAQW